MDQKTLRRFAPLYRSGRYMGADATLRAWLGLPEAFVVPTSVPHGVDFGQLDDVFELNSVEPLHWAHNEQILKRVGSRKPAIGLPHPFLIAARSEGARPGGTLIVGPPPGPENDERLHEILRAGEFEGAALLVKPKANSRQSEGYWRERGFRPTSIAQNGPPSYDTLAAILGRYERVVGCTFSSALVFAAAMGRRVEMLRGYRYRAYEVGAVRDRFRFDDPEVQAFVRCIAGSSAAEKQSRARSMLGESFEDDPGIVRERLFAAIGRLRRPLHFAGRYPAPLRAFLAEVALRFDKPGLVSRPIGDLLSRGRSPAVCIAEIDEAALWLDGPTDDNPRITPVSYRAGVTIPGDAVEQYSR